jgi:hypothetical protein
VRLGMGVTDDTAAFQAALVAGKTVQVPSGSYRLTSTVTLDTFSQGLGGTAGKNNCILIIDHVSGTWCKNQPRSMRFIKPDNHCIHYATELYSWSHLRSCRQPFWRHALQPKWVYDAVASRPRECDETSEPRDLYGRRGSNSIFSQVESITTVATAWRLMTGLLGEAHRNVVV